MVIKTIIKAVTKVVVKAAAKVVAVVAAVATVIKAAAAVNFRTISVGIRTTLSYKPTNNKPSVILHGIVGLMELVRIQAISAENRHKVIVIMQPSKTSKTATIKTAPTHDSSG